MLYAGCRVAAATDEHPVTRCTVSTDSSGKVVIEFEGPDQFDACDFALSEHVAIDFREISAPAGVRGLVTDDAPGTIVIDGSRLRADPETPWASLATAIAVSRVQRAQPGTLFFHGASVGVAGTGAVLMGMSGAGKTTLSLGLAERGHTFLGDEVAAVRLRTMELLPMRRRVHIKPGQRASGIDRALAERTWPTESLADGRVVTTVQIDELLPGTPARVVPLRVVVFLGTRGKSPAVQPAPASIERLKNLTPFSGTFTSDSPGAVAMRMLQLLRQTRCYTLSPGPIGETVILLENLIGGIDGSVGP